MRWLIFCVGIALSFIGSAARCRAGGVIVTPAQAAQYGELQALGLVLLDLGMSFGSSTGQITAYGSENGDTWSLSVNTSYLGNPFVLSVQGTFDNNTNAIAFSTASSQYGGLAISAQGSGNFFLTGSGSLGLDLTEKVVVGNQWQLSIPSASIIYASGIDNSYSGQYATNSGTSKVTITQIGDEFSYRFPGGLYGENPPTRIIPVPPPAPIPPSPSPEPDTGSMALIATLLVGGTLVLTNRLRHETHLRPPDRPRDA